MSELSIKVCNVNESPFPDGAVFSCLIIRRSKVVEKVGKHEIMILHCIKSWPLTSILPWSSLRGSLIPYSKVVWTVSIFPQCPVCTVRRRWWGAATGAENLASQTEPLFASGIVMETEALFIEFLGCSGFPAVYYSHHLVKSAFSMSSGCVAQPGLSVQLRTQSDCVKLAVIPPSPGFSLPSFRL